MLVPAHLTHALGNEPGKRPPNRVLPLDGLRGLLAFGVFLNHASIYQSYLRDGVWQTDSAFFSMLGQLGVTLFFMITAFLFYGRLIAEDGRPDWWRLYIGRVFRIGPVYLLTIALMFAVVAVGTGFQLRVPLAQLVGQVLGWLALGAGPCVDLNAFPDTRHLLAGVTWTLQSEWLFYALLPLLALATRRGLVGERLALIMPSLGLLGTLTFLAIRTPTSFPACVGPLFVGMVCAALPKASRLPARISGLLVAGIAVLFFLTCLNPRAPVAILLLGGTFYLLVSGCTVFGLLTSRPIRWLGSISYGVYLLHGLVLSRLGAIGAVRAFALASPVHHWLMVVLATALVIALAHLAHVLVEEPGIRLGKRVAANGPVLRRLKGFTISALPPPTR